MLLTTEIIHITQLTTEYPVKPDERYIAVDMKRFVRLTPLMTELMIIVLFA